MNTYRFKVSRPTGVRPGVPEEVVTVQAATKLEARYIAIARYAADNKIRLSGIRVSDVPT